MVQRKTSLNRKALQTRKRAKQKKPEFERSESWRYSKLSKSWRRPRGLDHKMRRKIKGWPPTVSVGYKGPKIARGLHPSGYREVLVHNAAEVAGIDPATQAVRIAHTVGRKKRAQVIAAARKKKLVVLNAKEVKEAEEEVKAKPEEEKPAKEKEEKAKPKRKPAAKKAAKAEAVAEEVKAEKEEAKPQKAEKLKKGRKTTKAKEGAEKEQ